MRHLRPVSASAAARWTVFEVLPTPPFWFPTAMTLVFGAELVSSIELPLFVFRPYGHNGTTRFCAMRRNPTSPDLGADANGLLRISSHRQSRWYEEGPLKGPSVEAPLALVPILVEVLSLTEGPLAPGVLSSHSLGVHFTWDRLGPSGHGRPHVPRCLPRWGPSRTTPGTAEPVGVSPPEAVDSIGLSSGELARARGVLASRHTRDFVRSARVDPRGWCS